MAEQLNKITGCERNKYIALMYQYVSESKQAFVA